jgi:hypothetical protein
MFFVEVTPLFRVPAGAALAPQARTAEPENASAAKTTIRIFLRSIDNAPFPTPLPIPHHLFPGSFIIIIMTANAVNATRYYPAYFTRAD